MRPIQWRGFKMEEDSSLLYTACASRHNVTLSKQEDTRMMFSFGYEQCVKQLHKG